MTALTQNGAITPEWYGNRELLQGRTIYNGPVDSTPLVTPPFVVGHQPVAVKAFGLRDGDFICVEMVYGEYDGQYFAEFNPPGNCGAVHMCACQNCVVIPISGRYRLNLSSIADRSDIVIVAHPTTIPADYSHLLLAQSCCSS